MNETCFECQPPILDQRELEMLEKLTKEYEKFIKPGKVSTALKATKDWLIEITPEKAKKVLEDSINAASDWDMIKKALEHAGKGFMILQGQASRFTFSKEAIVQSLKKSKADLHQFEQICTLRSYDIQKIIGNKNYKDLMAAFGEGAICGAPGLIGVPFNIALSFLLYFRAVQSVALHYGYDIKEDPSELEFAATVTIASLSPNAEQGVETLTGMIGKMMLAAEFTALRSALNKTYTEMAKKGGSELLYVQIRALANKAAQTALEKAGQEGMEAGVFRKLLEQVGKMLPKEAGKKAVPILGAVIGGFSDTYYMGRILKGANLIYHKRFLFEKEHRVNLLMSEANGNVDL